MPPNDGLYLLEELAGFLDSTTDVPSVIKRLIEDIAKFCGSSMGAVYLYADDDDLERFVAVGLLPQFTREVEKAGHNRWAVEDLVRGGAPPLLHTVGEGPYPSPIHRLAAQNGIAEFMAMPLEYVNRPLGVLLVFCEKAGNYTEEQRRLLGALCSLGALGIAHCRLLETRRWERKAQDQFLDVLSHELRTPLTSILGFTQIIRKRLVGQRDADSRLKDQIDLLWAQAQRLHRLLDTFVDMSSLERGDFAIEHEPLDVTGLVNMAVGQSQAQSRSRHNIEIELPGRAVWVQGDPRRLEHALIHVISNAIRYSPPDRPIVVHCSEAKDNSVTISVTDRGPGIPVEVRREVLKRFYPSDTRKTGGMGMGLYFSRAIVEAHGGALTIDSTQGQGTTVTISLPVERVPAAI